MQLPSLIDFDRSISSRKANSARAEYARFPLTPSDTLNQIQRKESWNHPLYQLDCFEPGPSSASEINHLRVQLEERDELISVLRSRLQLLQVCITLGMILYITEVIRSWSLVIRRFVIGKSPDRKNQWTLSQLATRWNNPACPQTIERNSELCGLHWNVVNKVSMRLYLRVQAATLIRRMHLSVAGGLRMMLTKLSRLISWVSTKSVVWTGSRMGCIFLGISE